MANRLPRKLAAILYADVAGYSRLTGEDEDETHHRLSEYLDLFSDLVAQHQGTVVHYAGDAVLAEFSTATDALQCASAIQNDLSDRNQPLPDTRRVYFRIGINLGEVIVDRGDIYGDGVNVAARLESLADPGGICISDSVRSAVGKKLELEYGFMGEQSVKNIAEPVRAYKVFTKSQLPADATTPLELPDQPAIAVLPFTNLSGDPKREYFSDGITDDIITELSRFRDLVVIARNSSFSYKGKSVKVQEIAVDLGVRYILEGSVRADASRVRISTQLIDSDTGHHMWAERYNREVDDIFDLQDEIAQHVASTVAGRLRLTAQELARRKPAENLAAYDHLLRGESIAGDTEENNRLAIEAFEKAIELDPTCARAYTGLAQHYLLEGWDDWGESYEYCMQRALECTAKAISLDQYDTKVLWRAGYVYVIYGEFDKARMHLARALELNANDADAISVMGVLLTAIGEPEESIRHCLLAMKLNPFCPGYYFYNLAEAYYGARQYAEVLEPIKKFIGQSPKFMSPYRTLAGAYAQLGRLEEAQTVVAEILAVEPNASVAKERDRNARNWKHSSDLEHWLDGLRKAGLPER